MNKVRFGVNYTPSQDWFFSWNKLDKSRISRDLEAIAELSLDHVRVLPLWTNLQPNRTLISKEAIDDVRTVAQLAGQFGLDVSVDALQGHLSSFDFIPSWLATWHKTNMFSDENAIVAQQNLIRELAGALSDLPNFLGMVLGNEVNQFTAETHPDQMITSKLDIDHWIKSLLEAAECPGFRLHSEYDAVWFMDNHSFVPEHVSQLGDMSVVHSWIFNGTAQTYGPLSFESTNLATYLVELARAFAIDPGRKIWVQEIGAPIPPLSEVEVADFCEASVRNIVDCVGVWGITWWCSHDVPRSLGDFPPLEHTLGLFDESGALKPIGRRFSELAKELRSSCDAPNRHVAVRIPVDEYNIPLSRRELGPGGGVFEKWLGLAKEGKRPTLVPSSKGSIELRNNGIDVLHDAPITGRGTYTSLSDEGTFGSEPE